MAVMMPVAYAGSVADGKIYLGFLLALAAVIIGVALAIAYCAYLRHVTNKVKQKQLFYKELITIIEVMEKQQ